MGILFKSRLEKQKKFPLKKVLILSYISGNGMFGILRSFFHFLKRKLFLYFRKWNFCTFQEMETLKNFLYFRTELAKPEKQKFVVC